MHDGKRLLLYESIGLQGQLTNFNFCSLLFFLVYLPQISIFLDIRNACLVVSYDMGGIKCNLGYFY